MGVDPTGQELKLFLDEDPGGPVIMLNMLRFREEGRPGYEEYGRLVQPFLAAVGGEVIYAGECSTTLVAPGEHDWDMVLLVRYPSRAAFLEMVVDPAYQEITGLRSAALEAAVLQATVPASG